MSASHIRVEVDLDVCTGAKGATQPVDTRGISPVTRKLRKVYCSLCPRLESAPYAPPPSSRAPLVLDGSQR